MITWHVDGSISALGGASRLKRSTAPYRGARGDKLDVAKGLTYSYVFVLCSPTRLLSEATGKLEVDRYSGAMIQSAWCIVGKY